MFLMTIKISHDERIVLSYNCIVIGYGNPIKGGWTLESTQLLINTNHAKQSNKDLHQKTNVLDNSNSKSFDQILSLFNMLQSPGVSENTPSMSGTEIEGSNLQISERLKEADWLELDTILQELFGLYQQVLPVSQTSSHTEDMSFSMSQSQGRVSQSIQQVIAVVQADLRQWLQNSGGIEQLSNFEKNQLIEKIAQYTYELAASGKINQNIPIEINQQISPSREHGVAHSVQEQVAIPINQTIDSRPVLEQSNKLKQIMRLFGITDQDIIPSSAAKVTNESPKSGAINPYLPSKSIINVTFNNVIRSEETINSEEILPGQEIAEQLPLKSNNQQYPSAIHEVTVNEPNQIVVEARIQQEEIINTEEHVINRANEDSKNPQRFFGDAVTTERLQVFMDNSPNDVQQPELIVAEHLFQLETVPKNVPGTTASTPHQSVTLTLTSFVPEVSEWMGRFFKISKDHTESSVAKFALYPEHLGHLEIKIASQKGQITAQILTDTQVAKEALEGQLTMLKQALQQQGLQVQKIEIIQHIPTIPELNQGNNQSFSQDGSNQHQFNQEDNQGFYSTTKAISNSIETEEDPNSIEKDKTIQSYIYGGTQVRASSRIDFSA